MKPRKLLLQKLNAKNFKILNPQKLLPSKISGYTVQYTLYRYKGFYILIYSWLSVLHNVMSRPYTTALCHSKVPKFVGLYGPR